MKRLLAPGLAAGLAALAIGGVAIAHPGAKAHAAKRQTITVKKVGKLGSILTDGRGRVVYLFEKDKHGKSACYGACAGGWPPVITSGKPRASGGASARKLGATKRKDGKKQVTYKGHPLYYFVGDTRSRQANGEGSNAFGAKWYVLKKSGNKLDND